MRAERIDLIGEELAIKWDDGAESYLSLERLRLHCPCASCKGEVDVMGNLYKGPERQLSPKSYQLVRITYIGGYAIQPIWADGHMTGLYSWDYLQRLANG